MEEAKSYDHRLQLFFAPRLETAIQSIDYVEIRPIGQVVKDGPIEFNIPGNTYHYVDLKHSKLSLKLKLTQENNLTIATGNKVGLVNNILHSIFSQCELSFQQQDTTKGISSNYPYNAYLDVITSSNTKLRELFV